MIRPRRAKPGAAIGERHGHAVHQADAVVERREGLPILPATSLAKRQIAGGQLHPRREMTADPEEDIAPLMRRWEQVKAGDGAVVLIGGEPGNREIAPRAAAHRVARRDG